MVYGALSPFLFSVRNDLIMNIQLQGLQSAPWSPGIWERQYGEAGGWKVLSCSVPAQAQALRLRLPQSNMVQTGVESER